MSRWTSHIVGVLFACSACEGTPSAGGGDSAAGDATGGVSDDTAGAAIATGPTRLLSGPSASVDKVDLLFMIDNSESMGDKQQLLRAAVPELLARLTNPPCLTADGRRAAPPASGDSCPAGQHRELPPITDINVGIISSSLGDAGANVECPGRSFAGYVPDRQDMAHLLGSLPRGAGAGTTPEGFLRWRPGTDAQAFNQALQQLVSSVGEDGCGFEQALESWYRFLADPLPYRELVRVQCRGSTSTSANCVQPAVDADNRILLDDTLLQQRAAFLRPDSLLAVVMLSDENDCSLQVGNQTWVVANTEDTRPFFRGSSTCASNPNDKCCYSCPLAPPSGCPLDPICEGDAQAGLLPDRLAESEDGRNLRCWDQKRRFGVDFLYPTLRYVNALTRPALCWNAIDLSTDGCAPDDVRQNPLFAEQRPREHVILAGMLGVPWQVIASERDSAGNPLPSPATQLRFKSAAELTADGTWAELVGSPGVPWRPAGPGKTESAAVPAVAPASPLMIESTAARAGVTPGNAMNGREYDTALGTSPAGTPDDLQYACIFPLAAPRDCAELDGAGDTCDCRAGANDRPICEQQPGVSAASTTQYWAKAYPGTRQLQVLEDLGDNAVVSSICARNVAIDTAPDYGYRPALEALFERVGPQLREPCLPEALPASSSGTPDCHLLQATRLDAESCTCDARGQRVPAASVAQAARATLAKDPAQSCSDAQCSQLCLCELTPLEGEALRSCLQDEAASGADGWCYIDAQRSLGNAELVSACPAGQQRRLRFIGQGPGAGATLATVCSDS